MKLTKDEIKYIDNYLLKNEVRFWDVRLELLDHIVSSVEDKIDNEGIKRSIFHRKGFAKMACRKQ